MIRFLPIILIPILVLAGLWYFRSSSTKETVTVSQTQQDKGGPIEVPKALPQATLEDRVESMEDIIIKLTTEVNKLKAAATPEPSVVPASSGDLETVITELKARVSALEKATPLPAAAVGKSTAYIPLGAGGSWFKVAWESLPEYEVSINPDNYPGYTGMVLEINFRLVDPTGTGYVRLYNMTDNSVISSELSTTSANYALQTTSSFKLPSGTKTYRLQVKSTQRDIMVQTARIRVNF